MKGTYNADWATEAQDHIHQTDRPTTAPDPGSIIAKLEASYLDILERAANPVVFSPAWVKLKSGDEEAPIITRGTINVIQGKAGVHKSRLAETLCSLLLSPTGEGDFFGFEKLKLGAGFYVAYIDTERPTKEHFPAAVQRIRQRAGLDERTDNGRFYPVSIKRIERRERLAAVKAWITHVRSVMEQKQVGDWNLFCVLDVVTDCTSSFNREDETLELFDFLGDLCESHNVSFLLVIHENPFSEKARGHAGTEALNKADTQMQIAYESGDGGEESDLIKVRFLKTRNAARPKPLYLQYSKAANGLVSADADAVNDHLEARKRGKDDGLLIEAIQAVFDKVDEIAGKGLFEAVRGQLDCSEKTAERRVKECADKGKTIIDKQGRKCTLCPIVTPGKPTVYRLQPNEPPADDDPPF